MKYDLYEPFERFCIMSESIGDIQALKYIEKEYNRDIAIYIYNKIRGDTIELHRDRS